MPTPTHPIVRCTGLQKTFTLDPKRKAELHVLKGIDLDIQGGEMVSIVGASGSGKSTLLHLLGGLDRPTSGTVFWDEKDISAVKDEELAKFRTRHVGFIFQFHHLLPEFTAAENIMIPMMIRGVDKEEARKQASALLESVGVRERGEHRPSELSGGEAQRVAVARALANKPRVIFADEPSGNLDSANTESLHRLLHELNEREQQSFVIVTHNEQLAAGSDRILRMVDGRLVTG